VNNLLYIDQATCTGCAACIDACPAGAISLDESEGVAIINQVLCTECLACLDTCPTGAIQRVELGEFVPAGDGEVVEGQVVERQIVPALTFRPLVTSRQPSRLATLAGTALTLAQSWFLPRAADALLDAVERRLTQRTNTTPSAASLRSGSRSLSRLMSDGKSGRHHRRRRRRRGK
jgi:NAD-dependent dihydropyrimidine dehydrogenase PreA subunit